MAVRHFTEQELMNIAILDSNADIDFVSHDDEVCEYCGAIITDDFGCDNCEEEDS